MNTEFSRLQVDGYRRWKNLDLPLAPLNVLIGANGVGKTSILDVMSLLASSANGRLQESISAWGGLSSLISIDRTRPMRLCLERPIEGHNPIEYELQLSLSGLGYDISRECLSQIQKADREGSFKYILSEGKDIRYFDVDKRRLEQPTWDHRNLETSLAQVPKMFREPEKFREILASSTLYHSLDVSPRAPVRLPQQMRPEFLPGANGEDLASCLYFLRETHRDRFDAIQDTLSAAFANFEYLSFPPVAAGLISMSWKDRAYTQPIYPHQLSEGTLRFLWLVTLLQSPKLPTVTMIDEPEVSLHPEMLRLLANLLREASNCTQLIVTTHSDRFVRFLEPHELVVCDLDEEGGSNAVRADNLDLETWLDGYSLDELWAMGRLGGRA